ncbi:hypothetical protein ABEX25_20550 [Paenibacillus thiaminolyticus]|uniref:hypothetical protein n=1 Tax=Paenibacillus thiaminolyticus TaxID=49283 RepID=UPI003D2DF2DD
MGADRASDARYDLGRQAHHDGYGPVILRRIRDEEQGRTEYEISRRLYPLDIAPEVLIEKMSGYIHGDLGAWTCFCGRDGSIIDFGEVRLGDRHFDAAAALVSTAPGHASVEEAVTRLEDFCRGYKANAEPLDLARLREQIHLWFVRGSVAVVRHHGANERTSRYCRRSMETMEHFDRVIDRCLGL